MVNYDWQSNEVRPKSKKWFDLCWLDLGKNVVPGWWTGQEWDGLNYKGDAVVRWKYQDLR